MDSSKSRVAPTSALNAPSAMATELDCPPTDNVPPKSGLLRRLSRSRSKIISVAGPSVEKASPDAVAQVMNANGTSVDAGDKLIAFTKLKAQLGRRVKKTKAKFPPSSWNVERSESGTSSDTMTQGSTLEEPPESTPEVSTAVNSSTSGGEKSSLAPGGTILEPPPPPHVETGNPGNDEPMSAASLARQIHSLLSSLPPFYALSPSGSFKALKSSSGQGDNSHDASGPSPDSKLLSLLSSASAMNGSISKGRESVWSILERLKYMPHPKPTGRAEDEDRTGTSSSDDDDDVETSSVMICCPLEPTEDSEVEIARSEIVSIDYEERSETPLEAKSGLNVWPFGKGKGKLENSTSDPPRPPPRVKEVRVWFPSRTKVSLQAAWWGYRIYLPPPVMRILSDKSLEAAKRAAMITAALSWLISNIPTAMLPPPLKAVVGVVKGIVPIIGYVGGFIAWSWNTIQSFDKGHGVILSATWLLPIALVPGTWDYTAPLPDIPDDTSQPPPTPPPKDASSSSRPSAPT